MMDGYRSRSFGEYHGGGARDGPGIQHTRSYSTSYTYTTQPKSKDLRRTKTSSGSSSKSRRWGLGDPDVQRKKRIATYNVYAVEGKMKGSFRKSFRWIKDKCSYLVYGC